MVLPADLQDLNGDGNTTELIPFDARGVGALRIAGGQSDVGAFEIQTTTAFDDAFGPINENVIFTGNNVFDDNGSGADNDPVGASLQLIAVNGSGASVGVVITLPSGALLKLNANGTFTYNHNGAFNDLPGPASGASNLATTDTFTYAIAGGGMATVTINIAGIDSDDFLQGTSGADVLNGGIGSDIVNGLAGDDLLIDTHNINEADAYDGGIDIDTLRHDKTWGFGVTFNLASGQQLFGGAVYDTYANIENLEIGGKAHLIGDAGQ